MPKSELGQRVAVAAIGIPVAIAAIVASGWYLGVLLAAVALGSALELFRLAERSGIRPVKVPGAAFAAGSVLTRDVAADALALAICHIWRGGTRAKLAAAALAARGRKGVVR